MTGVPAPYAAPLWLGVSRSVWGPVPLPLDLSGLGMPGCALRASPDVAVAMTGAGNAATARLLIPNDASLAGAQAFAQAFVVDPPANALGATATNGGDLRLGRR